MRQSKPLVLRLLPALLLIFFIAACTRNDEPAPNPQSNSGTEVVVIASDPSPPDHVVEYAKDDPNEDPSDNESPHPNKTSTTSEVGLGGGIGGGGGGGGSRGGYLLRRYRVSGASSAENVEEADPATPGMNWAEAEDNAARLEAKRGSETVGVFPLKHTNVNAKVSGTLAGTTVTQTFTNPYKEVIEAVYTFPLPGDSAINHFVMQAGDRRIVGVVRPRAEAKKIYEEAKARGRTATLLTQNRPNVFTQSVANIEVGGEVKVEITYYQSLKYENGRFEYMFPMTLGPRYRGGSGSHEVAPDADGDDTEDYNEVVLPPGMRSGMDIDLTLEIEAGLPIDITRTRSLAHEVDINLQREGNAVVTLSKLDAVPNRDFVLRWGIAAKQPSVGVLTHNDERGQFMSLQVQPQLDPADADVTPRELTFIMDVSGSMSGSPSQMSKEVIRKTLDHLKPDDIFNIVYFASGNGQVFDSPQANTPENISAAKDFLAKSSASGGTEMLAGLQRALKAEHDPRHLQIYAFLTDGYIGDENAIFETIKQDGRDARFFSFGIGSSVNRHLIDGIAEHGQGRAIYCLPRDGEYAEGAVQEFYNAIDMPVLCDIDIDWNGLEVESAYPSKFNDLFAAQPLSLMARYRGSGEHTINVNGRVGARHVSYPVKLNLDAAADNPAIATLWARQKIADLSNQGVGDESRFEQEITNVALDFNLMSRYTSFVAVDESRIVGDGRPMTVWQPVEMPEGVTFKGDSRPIEQGRVYEIASWGLKVGETPDGRVIVIEVKDGTPGAEAGMQPGQVIEKINGLDVSTLDRLESLLLQSQARIEVETSLTDEGQVVEAKFKLPELKAE
ncbi:MAG: VWA domain-containing protein [Planctomycetes bacterium]|nr:VWA domain-containing protein [Planctomycetota bacterium]